MNCSYKNHKKEEITTMTKFINRHRRSIRLKGYDYSRNGAYSTRQGG